MALLGVGSARVSPREVQPLRRELDNATHLPMPGSGSGSGFRGHTPKDWGMSQACARMVRKSRLHAHGLSHARI